MMMMMMHMMTMNCTDDKDRYPNDRNAVSVSASEGTLLQSQYCG